jgi:hypothetical protein
LFFILHTSLVAGSFARLSACITFIATGGLCRDSVGGLATVRLPASLTSVCAFAFLGTAIASIFLPKGGIEIGAVNMMQIPWWCFKGCTSITGVLIPSNVVEVGEGPFMDTTIADVNFSESGVAEVSLQPSLTVMNPRGFASCPRLPRVLHANTSITALEVGAFAGCMSLEKAFS